MSDGVQICTALEGEVGEAVLDKVGDELGLDCFLEELGEASCGADGDKAVPLRSPALIRSLRHIKRRDDAFAWSSSRS